MKRINFLFKLYRKGKIEEVEPSEEIKKAYLIRADESLSSAKTLLQIGNLRDSVALAYYAMYHSVIGLLFRIGIKCENHAAAIIMLKEIFSIDNAQISKAKTDRVDKQYYVDFDVSREEANSSIALAEEFRANTVDFIEKLNEDKIKEYRKKALALIMGK